MPKSKEENAFLASYIYKNLKQSSSFIALDLNYLTPKGKLAGRFLTSSGQKPIFDQLLTKNPQSNQKYVVLNLNSLKWEAVVESFKIDCVLCQQDCTHVMGF